jgi:hypothetical protein
MRNRQRRSATLPRLALLALVSLATFAPVAQALPEWKIEGKELYTYEPPEAPLLASISEPLELEIPWYATTIKCSGLTVSTGQILKPRTSDATIKLSTCTLSGPPFVAETCKLIEPLELTVKGQLIEHGGSYFILFQTAITGKPLATVKFKEGTECPLPLSNELTGTFVGALETTEQVKHPLTLSTTVSKLFGSDSLKFGTRPATLSGNAVLSLGGGHEGEKWAPAEYTGPPYPELGGQLMRNAVLVVGGNLSGSSTLGTILLFEGALGISCSEGEVFASIKNVAVQAQVEFSGCKVDKFSTSCTVYSVGEENGFISTEATGELYRHSGEHFVRFEAKEFTLLRIEGVICPWGELEFILGGSVAIPLSSPLKAQLVKFTTPLNEVSQELLEGGLFVEEMEEPVVLDGGKTELAIGEENTWSLE